MLSIPQHQGDIAQEDQSAAKVLKASIQRGLDARFWHLHLPSELERQYQLEQLAQRFKHAMRSGCLGLLVFNSFLLVDWFMAQDVFWFAVFCRLALFTPLFLIVLLSSKFWESWILSKRSQLFTDFLVMVGTWAAAFCLAAILYLSQSAYSIYYQAGFMVLIIFGNLVQQMAFRFAVTFSLGVLTISLVCMGFRSEYPDDLRWAIFQLLAVTTVFTLFANFLVAKTRRRRYLLNLREQELTAELNNANLRLQKLSRSDVLTGLSNRRHFHEYLDSIWKRAQKDGKPLSMLMLDVDHFKAYNDHYGHPAGDECLRLIAQTIEQHLRRPGDVVARYGGEEFVAILPETDTEAAMQAAERVRHGVEQLHIRHENSPMSQVTTVSVGVATMAPGPNALPDALISLADRALYEAKRDGRNRVRLVQ